MEGSSSTEEGSTTAMTMSQRFGANVESVYVAAVFCALQGYYATPTPTNTPAPTATNTPEDGWGRDFYPYSSSQPSVVASVVREGGIDPFRYDNIGNMTSRTESGTSWNQTFNGEGRLSQITDGTHTWKLSYDGDGARIKQVNPNSTITLFLGGGIYEVHKPDDPPETVTKYYTITRQRVIREGAGLHFMLTDHLGSVAAILDDQGSVESDERCLLFGGLRDSTGIGETDFSFNGQRNLSDIGLMDYNARWYSPSIGRFIQADTIVPSVNNPQAMNRYSYVYNNPLRFSDPSGCYICSDVDGYCQPGGDPVKSAPVQTEPGLPSPDDYGITFNGN